MSYLYRQKPAHLKRLPHNKRRLKLVRLHAEKDGYLTRSLLVKKGVTRALLAKLELAGLVTPVLGRFYRKGKGHQAVVLYPVTQLRSCWRELGAAGLRVEWLLDY